MISETLARPSRWQIWVLAARPKTLPAAFAPVLVGSAMAADSGAWAPVPAALCLVFALLVQIAANFANDYYDFVKGADTAERIGPTRAVAAGWVRPAEMRSALFLVIGLAFVAGLGLVPFGGWPLVVVGVACLVSAVAYTGGPWPIGYNGLGDLFVFIFFGLVGVGFTFYVQTGFFAWHVLIAGAGVGAATANILVVNNCRDWQTDRDAGKWTLVARFGPEFGRGQYGAQFGIALAVPLGFWLTGFGDGMLLPLVLGGWAYFLGRNLTRAVSGPEYNRLLAQTGVFTAVYALLLGAGFLLG